jgi:hypothetical protein
VTLHPPQLIVGARMLYLVWLPADAAANHDHYLYGTPKRPANDAPRP